MTVRDAAGYPKPRALSHISPPVLVLLVLLGLAGWAFLGFAVYLVLAPLAWAVLKATYPYDLIAGLALVSLALCWPDPDSLDLRRRRTIPK